MKLKEVIVVEGKTDYTFLKSFLDVDIIITNGSEISLSTLDMIKKANEERGVIVFTDPDYPGIKIRNKINEYVKGCKNAFVEKSKAIKGRKVGIAETSKEDILKALENVVTFKETTKESITVKDLYDLRLIGFNDSKKRRETIANHFHIGWCNGKTLWKRLNMFGITKEDIKKVIKDENSKQNSCFSNSRKI